MAGYANPIGPGLTPERIDQGVDYGGSGPLYALGSGTIVSTRNAGWPGGTFIGLKLDNGKYVYYAEDINPAVQPGQRVSAGDLVGRATGGHSGIEVGWAAPPGTGQSMADATRQDAAGKAAGDPGAYPTGYGVAFSNLVKSLGGPAGIIKGKVQGNVPSVAGMPSDTTATTAGVQTASWTDVLNPAKWFEDAWSVFLGMLGLHSVKDFFERLGLILLGAVLVLVGIAVLAEKSAGDAVKVAKAL